MGFCAGVQRAFDMMEKVVEKTESSVYAKHSIVHNNKVVKYFEDKNVIFKEQLSDIPQGSTVMFSAHGSPMADTEEGKANYNLYDSCCPLVSKGHRAIKKLTSEGYHIIIIGNKNHVEVIGLSGQLPNSNNYTVVSNIQDVAKLEIPASQPISYITQTTLSLDDTSEVISALKDKFPHLLAPTKDYICYATQNRQNAVKDVVHDIDCLLVASSPESSNGNKLCLIGKNNGIKTFMIEDAQQISNLNLQKFNNIGLTAAASTPQSCIDEIVNYMKKLYNTEVLKHVHTEETESFIMPKSLR